MAYQGINTGTIPDDGTGDSLLDGAVKINDNFEEIYNLLGDGINLPVGIVEEFTAGSNVSISTSYGSVEISVDEITNIDITATSMVVSGVSTLGVVTGATYYGDGSNLTGLTHSQVSGAMGDVVDDTTPQLGGDLDLNGRTINGTGNINITGSSRFNGPATCASNLQVDGTATCNIVSIPQDTDNFGDTNRIILGNDLKIYSTPTLNRIITNEIPLGLGVEVEDTGQVTRATFSLLGIVPENDVYYGNNSHVTLGFGTEGTKLRTTGSGVSVTGGGTFTGIITAASFSGSNTLQSRTTVSGSTTSIGNNGIGNTDITGFKSYALMKVGLSTAGWLRIYTDSASRLADVSRSVGEDPAAGSGVIAEVVTTGISTTQIISPFVTGGNLDEPVTDTIYVAITNQSGTTQSINTNLTILKLED